MTKFNNPSARRCRQATFPTAEAAHNAATAKGPPWRARRCGRPGCGQWHLITDETTQLRLTPSHVRAAITGRKTTHRIPAGHTRHCPYRAGGEYTIVHDDGTIVDDARVIVTRVDRHPLGDTSEDTIELEGFENVGAFLDYWQDRHGEITDRRLAADVWLVTFMVEHHDTVRLPAADAVQAYTGSPHRALTTGAVGNLGPVPEPEAVDPAALERLTLDARTRFRAFGGDRHAREELKRLGRVIRQEGLAAVRRGVDVSEELDRIGRELDSMRRKREEHANQERRAA